MKQQYRDRDEEPGKSPVYEHIYKRPPRSTSAPRQKAYVTPPRDNKESSIIQKPRKIETPDSLD